MATKKSNPALEKREEKEHKDLDRDGEKGESSAHKAKVFGGKGKMAPPFAKKGEAPAKSKKKMCSDCTKAGKSSCSHM